MMPGITGYRGSSQVGAGGELTAAEEAWVQAGAAGTGTIFVGDNVYVAFGNTSATPDAAIGWNTAQTVDGWYFGTSAGQNTVIFAEYADRAFDFAHGAQTNPTLFGHSATQSTTQWWSITHDQTNTIIASGAGDIIFQPAGTIVGISRSSAGTTQVLTATNSDNTNAASSAMLRSSVGGGSAGDAMTQYLVSGVTTWTTGIDNSDSDAFVIAANATLGTTNTLRITADRTLTTFTGAQVRLTDTTAANGLDFLILATANQTINTISTTTGSLLLQNQTFTAGTTHNAVTMSPTWAAENQVHRGLAITPTQNGANSGLMDGLYILMTKATAASILGTMSGIEIDTPVVTGTVTASQAISIANQTNANVTLPRGIVFASAGVANSIVFGTTIVYGSAANVLSFADSSDTRAITFTLNDVGTQTITATAGGLTLTPTSSDVFITNGTGLVIGNTAQITSSTLNELQVLGTGGADSSATLGRWSANAFSGALEFVKSRNATIGSSTIVNDNDTIGELRFFPDDGADFATEAATFFAEVDDASPAADDIGMAFVWEQMPGAAGASRETLRLAANGTLTVGAGGFVINAVPVGTAGFTMGNNAGARTVPLSAISFNGTAGLPAGGSLFDIDVTQTGAGANPLFDIDVTALYTGDLFNAVIGAVAYAGTMLELDLGDTSTTGTVLNLLAGTGARTTSVMSITDGTTSTGQGLIISKTGGSYSNNTGYIDYTRTGNFTGVDTQTAIDLRIAATNTITEPGAGTFAYTSVSFDLGSLAITAGAGTSVINTLQLVACTDADAGTNLALAVSGKIRTLSGSTSSIASAAGTLFESQAATYTGNNASSTIAIGTAFSLAVPTFANGTATLTMTDAATLYIAGIPVASTNVAFTNTAVALWVDAGNVRFDGSILLPTSGSTINFNAGDVVITHSSNTLAFTGGTNYTFDDRITTSGEIVFDGTTTTTGAGAVALTGAIHEITTNGVGNAMTLADGTEGQVLRVVYVAEGAGSDTAVLTPTNLAGSPTTITFNAIGDAVTLLFTAGTWFVVGANGAVVA